MMIRVNKRIIKQIQEIIKELNKEIKLYKLKKFKKKINYIRLKIKF